MAQQIDKEEQKKLLIEMMEADKKDGLYDPVVSKVETTQMVKVLLHDACIKFLKENGNVLYKDDKVYYQFPSCWYKVTNEENIFEEVQGSPDTTTSPTK